MSLKPTAQRLVLLLAIVATLVVTSVAASPAHFHGTGNLSGSCDLCVIAHLPIIQPVLATQILPPGISAWNADGFAPAKASELFHQTSLSRGPPALSF